MEYLVCQSGISYNIYTDQGTQVMITIQRNIQKEGNLTEGQRIYERLILGATQQVGLGDCHVGCRIRTKLSGYTWCCTPGVLMHGHENQGVEVVFLLLTITFRPSFVGLFLYLFTILGSTGFKVQVFRGKFFQ